MGLGLLKRQVEALRKSWKEKWEGIVQRGKVEFGSDDCECCEEFKNFPPVKEDDYKICKNCPIFIETGGENCINFKQYVQWTEFFSGEDGISLKKKVTGPISFDLATNVSDFIRDLYYEYLHKYSKALESQQRDMEAKEYWEKHYKIDKAYIPPAHKTTIDEKIDKKLDEMREAMKKAKEEKPEKEWRDIPMDRIAIRLRENPGIRKLFFIEVFVDGARIAVMGVNGAIMMHKDDYSMAIPEEFGSSWQIREYV